MPTEAKPSFPLRTAWDPSSRGEGAVCLANCTLEPFVFVRAKGSGKLRSATLLAGTELPDDSRFAYRMCEPGWRILLGPGQAVGLETRKGPCAGQALFSLQDAAGKALASLGYTLAQGPEAGPARGEMTLQPQSAEARDLLLVTGGLPGNVFLVRQAQLGALRKAIEDHARELPPGAGPLTPAVGA
jgi:hypothetical protein